MIIGGPDLQCFMAYGQNHGGICQFYNSSSPRHAVRYIGADSTGNHCA